MAASAHRSAKKYFTAAEANAMLPLVRRIVQDIATLANEVRERKLRLLRIRSQAALGPAAREEVEQMEAANDRAEAQMWAYVEELDQLKIELKDPHVGLIDFLSRRDGRDVYLCWKLGEPAVEYWHELHAGFTGRQKLPAPGAENRF